MRKHWNLKPNQRTSYLQSFVPWLQSQKTLCIARLQKKTAVTQWLQTHPLHTIWKDGTDPAPAPNKAQTNFATRINKYESSYKLILFYQFQLKQHCFFAGQKFQTWNFNVLRIEQINCNQPKARMNKHVYIDNVLCTCVIWFVAFYF